MKAKVKHMTHRNLHTKGKTDKTKRKTNQKIVFPKLATQSIKSKTQLIQTNTLQELILLIRKPVADQTDISLSLATKTTMEDQVRNIKEHKAQILDPN